MTAVIRWQVLAILMLFSVGCSTVTRDIRVQTEAAPSADFSRYNSFAWLGVAAALHDPEGTWVRREIDVPAEIKFLVDRELRDHGMSPVVDSPDLLVVYAIGVDMAALELVQDPETQLELARNTPKGAVIVILANAASRQPVWIGAATAEIQQNPGAQTVRKRLDYAITKMFKELPK